MLIERRRGKMWIFLGIKYKRPPMDKTIGGLFDYL